MTPLSLRLNERPDVRAFPYDATWYWNSHQLLFFDDGADWLASGGMILLLLPGVFALSTPIDRSLTRVDASGRLTPPPAGVND
jgi:hypothetical protein